MKKNNLLPKYLIFSFLLLAFLAKANHLYPKEPINACAQSLLLRLNAMARPVPKKSNEIQFYQIVFQSTTLEAQDKELEAMYDFLNSDALACFAGMDKDNIIAQLGTPTNAHNYYIDDLEKPFLGYVWLRDRKGKQEANLIKFYFDKDGKVTLFEIETD